MDGAFQSLTLDEVVEINRQMISRFGGAYFGSNRNLVNPGSLEHVLEEIQGSFFGQEPYPTIIEKAAVLGLRDMFSMMATSAQVWKRVVYFSISMAWE